MRKVIIEIYGEGVRIDVLDNEGEVLDSYHALLAHVPIYDITVIDGNKVTRLEQSNLSICNPYGLMEDYEIEFDGDCPCILEEPKERFESVDSIYYIKTKETGVVEIELPESEEFDQSKICLVYNEFALPEWEEPVYCGLIYDGKQYSIELDLETAREISMQKIWGVDDDE